MNCITPKFPIYDEFRTSFHRQCFTIPDSIIFYITQNPSTSELYQKMIQTCKYFFIKNPILTFHCLHFEENEWKICIDESCFDRSENHKFHKINLNLNKFQSKIYVDRRLRIETSNSLLTSSLIPKLYNGDIESLIITQQNISFNDLLFFSQEMTGIILDKSTVYFENGKIVPVEIVVANFPKLQTFIWYRKEQNLHNFSKTVKELLKISHFKNIRHFKLLGLNESFDIETFFDYLKRNTHTKFILAYFHSVSEQYKEKLQKITDAILDAEFPRPYFPPYLIFNGQIRRAELFSACHGSNWKQTLFSSLFDLYSLLEYEK